MQGLTISDWIQNSDYKKSFRGPPIYSHGILKKERPHTERYNQLAGIGYGNIYIYG